MVRFFSSGTLMLKLPFRSVMAPTNERFWELTMLMFTPTMTSVFPLKISVTFPDRFFTWASASVAAAPTRRALTSKYFVSFIKLFSVKS